MPIATDHDIQKRVEVLSALSVACRSAGVAVRAQLILHDAGARWFAPDDHA